MIISSPADLMDIYNTILSTDQNGVDELNNQLNYFP